MKKKTVLGIVAVVLIICVAGIICANALGGIISLLFGAGTGEWITKKATLGQCCLEHLFMVVPIAGELAWIGSIVDNFQNVEEPRINILFTTIPLSKKK